MKKAFSKPKESFPSETFTLVQLQKVFSGHPLHDFNKFYSLAEDSICSSNSIKTISTFEKL